MFPRNTHRDGAATDAATEDPPRVQQTPGESAVRMPRLENMLQLAALAGAVVYGALFTGYRAFYESLGIDPEDVGISNAFILVRSIAFVVLTALVALTWFSMTRLVNNAINRRAGKRSRSFISYGYNIAVAIAIGIFIVFFASPGWPPLAKVVVVVSVLVISIVLTRVADQSSYDDRRKMGAIAAVIVGFLASTTAIHHYAAHLAEDVNAGKTIAPITIFGIPILDVSSDDIRATWVCPEAQRPPPFTEALDSSISGFLIGESDTSYIIRLAPATESKTVSVPQNCVMLTRLHDQ
jgi:hypothetical protein